MPSDYGYDKRKTEGGNRGKSKKDEGTPPRKGGSKEVMAKHDRPGDIRVHHESGMF